MHKNGDAWTGSRFKSKEALNVPNQVGNLQGHPFNCFLAFLDIQQHFEGISERHPALSISPLFYPVVSLYQSLQCSLFLRRTTLNPAPAYISFPVPTVLSPLSPPHAPQYLNGENPDLVGSNRCVDRARRVIWRVSSLAFAPSFIYI